MKKLNKILLGLSVSSLSLVVACPNTNIVPCETDEDCADLEDTPVCGEDEGYCIAGGGEGEECDEATYGISDSSCLEDRTGADPELCSGTECVDPNEVTANCDGGAGASYGGGPIVYSIETITTGTAAEACDSTNSYIAEVYSETAFDTSLYSQRLEYISEGGTAGFTYSDAAGGDLIPAIDDLGDGYYLLTFYLCEPVGDGAVTINDNDSAGGNAYCIDLAI